MPKIVAKAPSPKKPSATKKIAKSAKTTPAKNARTKAEELRVKKAMASQLKVATYTFWEK